MTAKILFQNILENLLNPNSNINSKDVKYNLKDNKFHSVNDEPAFETTTGIKAWFKDGMLHRDTKDPVTGETLPAFIKKSSGGESLSEWWLNDVHHREDIDKNGKHLPAEIFICGESSYKSWYNNGLVHRPCKEGPAYINRYTETYMENGLPHRDNDLPAVLSTDRREMEWWFNGKRHRETRDPNTDKLLPAVIRLNGIEEYWVDGRRIH